MGDVVTSCVRSVVYLWGSFPSPVVLSLFSRLLLTLICLLFFYWVPLLANIFVCFLTARVWQECSVSLVRWCCKDFVSLTWLWMLLLLFWKRMVILLSGFMGAMACCGIRGHWAPSNLTGFLGPLSVVRLVLWGSSTLGCEPPGQLHSRWGLYVY